ncbi:hypothetical protein B0A49_00084 [Cryomyces minteri]|uniref:DSC E3 ubiquitin ligase complex subunit A n=1 Tax=Cryomyces minteri TaxID=331657 RepID=A0A4U0Y2M3_9PEZI|nr:hypothetical protein B0A49_00084 [Cryomyces minteri]
MAANPRTLIPILILLFILLSPDSQQPATLDARLEIDQIIQHEQDALSVLNSSHYGGFNSKENRYLNLTGCREEHGFVWDALPGVRERARGMVGHVLGDARVKRLDGIEQEEKEELGLLYQNVTGYVRGSWVRSKLEEGLQRPSVNLSVVAPEGTFAMRDWNRNITGQEGKIRMRLKEQENRGQRQGEGNVTRASATLTIRDSSSWGDGWEMALYGVHFLDFGGILMTTTSDKFAGIFALPHLALSENTFHSSQQLLKRTLNKTIELQKNNPDALSNPWSSSPDTASNAAWTVPHCEYIVYLQQHPVPSPLGRTGYWSENQLTLDSIEDELRFPTGRSAPPPPPMQMSMLLFSPDCGFILESKGPPDYAPQEGLHLRGPKLEALFSTGRRHVLFYAFAMSAQLLLLVRQMKEASTPSTRSRISLYTVAMLAMGDGFAAITFMIVGMFLDGAWLTLITTAFVALLAVSFFGMKFLLDVWSVQAPERRRQERQQQTAATATTAPSATPAGFPIITAAGADTLPPPVTARTAASSGAMPIILPPDQDEPTDAAANPTPPAAATDTATATRSDLGALYTRFYFILLLLVFLSLHATSWPPTLRSLYTTALSFLYLSFWTPQLYRNVQRNCRRALSREFIFGQSVCRLAPFAYFTLRADNVLFADTDWRLFAALVAWVWIQALLLLGQEVAGPRVGVPKGWAPPAYDYHRVVVEDEEGAGMPIGASDATDPVDTSPSSADAGGRRGSRSPSAQDQSRKRGTRVYDCAICREDVEVAIVAAGGSSSGGGGEAKSLLARRAYMLTPCRHIFHTECLEGWMKYRLQCPICREVLPPL